MVFIANEQTDYSLVIEYPIIGVHAVSRENDIWKRPCIYCQISSEDDGEDSRKEEPVSEEGAEAEQVMMMCKRL